MEAGIGAGEAVGSKEASWAIALVSLRNDGQGVGNEDGADRRMEIQSGGSSVLEAGLTFVTWLLSDFRKVHEEASHTGSRGHRLW